MTSIIKDKAAVRHSYVHNGNAIISKRPLISSISLIRKVVHIFIYFVIIYFPRPLLSVICLINRSREPSKLRETRYNDVIMGAMASQITSLTIVCSTVCQGADERKYQSSVSLAFVRGIHRGPWNSPTQRDRNAENVSIWRHHHEHWPFLADEVNLTPNLTVSIRHEIFPKSSFP